MAAEFDLDDIKRRMRGAVSSLKSDLAGLRTGRASTNLLDPIQIDAYGALMPINQVATVSVPEPRLLSVQVWDRSMVGAVEKAIRESDLGLNPQTEGQVIRLRIPEMNEQRRKEMVKVAHKYAEEARVAIRHVRRDGLDTLKKLEKDGDIGQDDEKRQADQVQKATDEHVSEVDQVLAAKEKRDHAGLRPRAARLRAVLPIGPSPGENGDHAHRVERQHSRESRCRYRFRECRPWRCGHSPRHVAVIMDGNGRWAAQRGLPRQEGHRRGVEAVRRCVRAAGELGVAYLTLYAFSSENWRRPPTEITVLMGLLKRYVRSDLDDLARANVRIRIIGSREGLSSDILGMIEGMRDAHPRQYRAHSRGRLQLWRPTGDRACRQATGTTRARR